MKLALGFGSWPFVAVATKVLQDRTFSYICLRFSLGKVNFGGARTLPPSSAKAAFSICQNSSKIRLCLGNDRSHHLAQNPPPHTKNSMWTVNMVTAERMAGKTMIKIKSTKMLWPFILAIDQTTFERAGRMISSMKRLCYRSCSQLTCS